MKIKYTIDRLLKLPAQEVIGVVMNIYKRLLANLIISIANVRPGTNQTIQWDSTKGSPGIPLYVSEVPVIFISVQCQLHLAYVPKVKACINACDGHENTLSSTDYQVLGRLEFICISIADAFCGLLDIK